MYKRRNAPIRKAIWEHIGDLQPKKIKIPVDIEDAKKVWSAVQEDFPSFALFQSDRTSNDEDDDDDDDYIIDIDSSFPHSEKFHFDLNVSYNYAAILVKFGKKRV